MPSRKDVQEESATGQDAKTAQAEEGSQTQPSNSVLKIIAVVIIIAVVLAVAWWGYSNYQSQPVATTTTTVATTTTTTIVTTTTALTTTTTVDPLSLYPQESVTQFEQNCSLPAVITNPINQQEIKVYGNLQETFVMRGLYGSLVPLQLTNATKQPPTLDATGSTTYLIYGTPVIINDSDDPCWMNVQRITTT
jgi:hypothetical protein